MLVEVHAFISGGFIVTLHERPLAELAVLRQSLRHQDERSEQFVIYRILDALTDSFFPALEALGEQIDQLEAETLEEPKDELNSGYSPSAATWLRSTELSPRSATSWRLAQTKSSSCLA